MWVLPFIFRETERDYLFEKFDLTTVLFVSSIRSKKFCTRKGVTETPQILKHSEVTMERQLDQRLQHSCFSVCCGFCEIYKKAFMRHLRATARCILRNARHILVLNIRLLFSTSSQQWSLKHTKLNGILEYLLLLYLAGSRK